MAIVIEDIYISSKADTGEEVYLNYNLRNNGTEDIENWIAKVYNEDTGQLLWDFDRDETETKFPLRSGYWNTIPDYMPIIFIMPNKNLRLRLKSGVGSVIEDERVITIPHVSPSGRQPRIVIKDVVPLDKYVGEGFNFGVRYTIENLNWGEEEIYDPPLEKIFYDQNAFYWEHIVGDNVYKQWHTYTLKRSYGIADIIGSHDEGFPKMGNSNIDVKIKIYCRDPIAHGWKLMGGTRTVTINSIPGPDIPQKSYMNVNSNPSNAVVHLNEENIGETPIGNHEVK